MSQANTGTTALRDAVREVSADAAVADDPRPLLLLIEDNVGCRTMLTAQLESRYRVLAAADGAEAMRLCSQKPQLALVDQVLPDTDGLTLASQLHRELPQLRMVALSGMPFRTDASTDSRVQLFDELLLKPVDRRRLLGTLERVAARDTGARARASFGRGRAAVVAHADPAHRDAMRSRLAQLGFEVTAVSDGRQALQSLLQSSSPAALVSAMRFPEGDGFALTRSVRAYPELSAVPVLLLGEQAVSAELTLLASRAGVNAVVPGTLDALEQALRALPLNAPVPMPVDPTAALDIEREQSRQLAAQLKRATERGDALATRCATLTIELSVIAGISDALLAHGELDENVDEVISAHLNMVDLWGGVLYLRKPDGFFQARPLGSASTLDRGQLDTFFGQPGLLEQLVAAGTCEVLPSADHGDDTRRGVDDVLHGCGSSEVLVVPLLSGGRRLGALLAIPRGSPGADWAMFVQTFANQIAQTLALAEDYARRGVAERNALAQEKAAREQSRLLDLVMRSLGEGVVVADQSGHFLVANPAARRLAGLSGGERSFSFEAMHFDLFHDDGLTPCAPGEAPLSRALAGEKVDQVEMKIRPVGQGDMLSVSVTARPLRSDAGELEGGVAVFRDVTAQRRAEEAGRASRSKWQALADHLPDTIAYLDREGVFQFVNRPISGRTMDEVIGSSWLDWVPADQRAQMKARLDEVVTTGRSVRFEVNGPGAFWFATRLAPIIEDGQTTGVVLILTDVTQTKQAEAQLLVADRMVSVGTLAAGVAHEINNPLAAVIANVEMALKDAKDMAAVSGPSELEEMLIDARDSADRVRQIVRDLKIFSRAGEEERTGAVNVRQVLDSTLRMAWNEIRHRARLEKKFVDVPAVSGNESRLGQVFLNLVVNAAQAIPLGHADQNVISVTTRLDPSGMVAIDVTDTGSGIPPDVMARLFTPFFTTKKVGEGTGLGLSICQRIVSGFGGNIMVNSTVGQGTTFTVLLPKAGAAQLELAGKADKPGVVVTAPSRRGRVLVIDDEAAISTAVRRILDREHEVVVFERAEEALGRVMAGDAFDVILCDLMMPQMTGMEFHAEVLRQHPELAPSLIFLTGGAFTTQARQFLDNVPNLRLEKPFDAQQLRVLVNQRVH